MTNKMWRENVRNGQRGGDSSVPKNMARVPQYDCTSAPQSMGLGPPVPKTEWETNSPCEIPSSSDVMIPSQLQQYLQHEIGVVEGTTSTYDGNSSSCLTWHSSMKIRLAKVLPNRRVSPVTIHYLALDSPLVPVAL